MFHFVSCWRISKTQNIPELGLDYKEVGFTLRMSDCEELVGVTHRG